MYENKIKTTKKIFFTTSALNLICIPLSLFYFYKYNFRLGFIFMLIVSTSLSLNQILEYKITKSFYCEDTDNSIVKSLMLSYQKAPNPNTSKGKVSWITRIASLLLILLTSILGLIVFW